MSGQGNANPAPNRPQQPVPPQPVAPQPVRGLQPRRGQPRPQRPAITDWKKEALLRLGLQSKAVPQAALVQGVAATKASLLQPNGAAAHARVVPLAAAGTADPAFQAYADALRDLEADPARSAALRARVTAAATAYLAQQPANVPLLQARVMAGRRQMCQRMLSDLRRYDTCEQVEAAGNPPWNSRTAMQVASLKATLDFESLPVNEQTARVNAGAGVTTSLWVNATDAAGRQNKTFIFKPQMDGAVEGFPPGGEPVREALAGRVADLLNGALQLDIRMPETHVVSISRDRIPPEAAGAVNQTARQKDGPLVGSLQTFSASTGELRAQSRAGKSAVTVPAAHSLALLDIITLNCDRHGGNIMTAPGHPPGLVPIDHGLAFPPADQLVQFRQKLSSDHNTLLSLPASHAPFEQGMLDKIAALDPDTFVNALRTEMDVVGAAHPAVQGTLNEDSLRLSRLSMQFLKMAAPTLSPAAIQVAMGRHALRLFDPALDPAEFPRVAQEVIDDTEADQEGIAEYFQMPKAQMQMVQAALKANGWDYEVGLSYFDGELLNNLTGMMALYHSGARKPPPAALQQADRPDDEVKAALLAAFPRTLARSPQQIAEAIDAWMAFQRIGLSKDAAIAELQKGGAHPADVGRMGENLVLLMQAWRRREAIRNAAAQIPPSTPRDALKLEIDYLRRLQPMLPANSDPEILDTLNSVGSLFSAPVRMTDNRARDFTTRVRGATELANDAISDRLRRIAAALRDADDTPPGRKLTPVQYSKYVKQIDEGNLDGTWSELRRIDPNLAGL